MLFVAQCRAFPPWRLKSIISNSCQKLCKHKIVIPFSWNASLLHTICGFYLPSPLLFILPHLFYPYHFFFRATNATFFTISFHILDSIFAWEWINWNRNRKFLPANLWQRQSNSIKLKKREKIKLCEHWNTEVLLRVICFFSIFSFSHGTFLWLYLIFFLCKKNNRVQ